jgi:hypothetical protein
MEVRGEERLKVVYVLNVCANQTILFIIIGGEDSFNNIVYKKLSGNINLVIMTFSF